MAIVCLVQLDFVQEEKISVVEFPYVGEREEPLVGVEATIKRDGASPE